MESFLELPLSIGIHLLCAVGRSDGLANQLRRPSVNPITIRFLAD